MKFDQKTINAMFSEWDLHKTVLLGFVLFLIVFRIHNVLAFNPFWGYDGGGHIDYVMQIAEHNRFPTVEDNYIAWHEPIYYLGMAAVAKVAMVFTDDLAEILKTLGLVQVVLSFVVACLTWKLVRLVTKDRAIQILSFVVVSLLPAMTQASMFLTNELLNYAFIFGLLCILVKFFVKQHPETKHYLLFGITAGLALNNKITAIIVIAIAFGYMGLTCFKKKDRTQLKQILASVALLILLILPWQIYRTQHISSLPTINNQHFLAPVPLAIDDRLHFYTKFDADIFTFPYWYSGGTAFWSMLYADSFYDYYGMMENDNFIADASSEELVQTTINDTFVTSRNFELTSKLVWLGVVPAILLLIGLGYMTYLSRKSKEHTPKLALVTTLAFLAALLYFSYRYPYYDMGIVKSIFIYPGYFFLIVYGFIGTNALAKRFWKPLFPLLSTAVMVYALVLVQAFWVMSYGY